MKGAIVVVSLVKQEAEWTPKPLVQIGNLQTTV
jgi:hypothetical protein